MNFLITHSANDPLIFSIWAYGLQVAAIISGITFLVMAYVGLSYSIRFNYHLYIKHGEFSLIGTDDLEKREHRKEIADFLIEEKKSKMAADFGDAPWLLMIFLLGLVAACLLIATILWPISFIGFGPFGLIKLVAYKKRKKQIFIDKLEGVKRDKNSGGHEAK